MRTGVSVNDGGTYVVTASNGRCSSSFSVNVTVNPTPVASRITSNGPVCVGGTLSLSTATVANAFYSWNGPNLFVSTSQSPTIYGVTNADAGIYSLSVTVGNCTSPVVTSNIVVDKCVETCPVPNSLGASSQTTQSAVVTWQTSVGTTTPQCYVVSYGVSGTNPTTWSTMLVPAPNTQASIQNLTPGTRYEFQVKSNCSGCGVSGTNMSLASATGSFSTAMLKSSDMSAAGFLVYPNPTHGQFVVNVDLPNSGSAHLRIVDATGRLVYESSKFVPNGNNTIEIDLSGEAAGIYHVELRQGHLLRSTKVVLH